MTMDVEIPSDINDFVKNLVATGRYESEQAAVAEGLRLLKSREQLRSDVEGGFRQIDEGQWVDGETLFADVHREIDAIENDQ